MSKAWKKLDLGGEGLQTANLRYNQAMRRPIRAYSLMVAFPLGLHRWYLHEPVGAIVYPLLSALTIGLGLSYSTLVIAGPLIPLAGLLVFDLFWVDRRCIKLNKTLRMQQFMRPGKTPPPGYRGRYPEDDSLEAYVRIKDQERAGHQPVDPDKAARNESDTKSSPPSFNEQEAMLRELARTNKGRRKPDQDE